MRSSLTYLVLLYHVAIFSCEKFRCDYVYTDDGWFKYHEMPLSWHDAYLQCKYEGGMLASPVLPGMKSTMQEIMCNTGIFTGIHSTFARGQYYTIDGIALDKIHHTWAPFEPNNKNNAEYCIAMDNQGRLSDVSCDETRPYICHKRKSFVDVNVCGTIDPDYRFDIRTQKCYKFHIKPKRFAPAFFTCSAEGGHLAIINSEEELMVIHELHSLYPPEKIEGRYDKNSAILGFYYEEDVADWTTIHGQTLKEAGYAKFQGGQPSNSSIGEYCGAVYRNGSFNDVSCHLRFAFICEKSPYYPNICESKKNQTEFKRNCYYDTETQIN